MTIIKGELSLVSPVLCISATNCKGGHGTLPNIDRLATLFLDINVKLGPFCGGGISIYI